MEAAWMYQKLAPLRKFIIIRIKSYFSLNENWKQFSQSWENSFIETNSGIGMMEVGNEKLSTEKEACKITQIDLHEALNGLHVRL